MTVQDKINRILWDRRMVTFEKDVECPGDIDYVIIRDLTLDDRNLYLMTRDLEEHKARQEGVPSEGDLMNAARMSGYWGKIEDDIESNADAHIAFLEAEFESKKKFRSRQNIIKTQIDDAQAKKQWVQRKRNEFRLNSAEYLAHEIAAFKIVCRVVLRPDGKPVFPTEEYLIECRKKYFQWTYYLLNEVMGESTWETTTIRSIARSVEWRMFWTLTRENLPALFNRSIGDLTLNQKLLVYWSRVYDSALESHEPPERDTIEDDDLFDQWLANRDLRQNEEKNSKTDEKKHHAEQGHVLDGEHITTCTCGAKEINKKKYLGEKIPHQPTCMFGMWHQYSIEEREAKANLIYGRNTKNVRQMIDRDHETVLQKGLVQEQDLRDKNTRKHLGMKTNVIPIRRKR